MVKPVETKDNELVTLLCKGCQESCHNCPVAHLKNKEEKLKKSFFGLF